MRNVFYAMRAVAMFLIVIALGKFLWTWDFDLGHPVHYAIGFLVIGSELLNRKYRFDDTWQKKVS